MGSASDSSTTLSSLFTWHIPLPHGVSRREAEEQREADLALGMRDMDPESLDARVIAAITGAQKPSAAQLHTLVTEADDPRGPGLDPLLSAVLLHRFALAALEGTGVGGRGRRAAGFAPTVAYEAIAAAIGRVEDELGAAGLPLPTEVHAALTVTFIRAALACGDAPSAAEALAVLEANEAALAPEYVRAWALQAIGLAHLLLGRPDDALIPAQRSRSLSRQIDDRAGQWRAERVRAHAASVAGRPHAEELAHRDVAELASRLADDLATDPDTRAQAELSELESRAVLARLALTHSRLLEADAAAQGMLQRIERARQAGDLDPAQAWEFEIDARITRMLVAGLPDSPVAGKHRAELRDSGRGRRRAEPTPGPDGESEWHTAEARLDEYRIRRTRTLEAIAAAPAGHEQRGRWWATYADDRHAYILAAHGRTARAARVTKRVMVAWQELGEGELAVRCERDLAELEKRAGSTPSSPEGS